MDWQWIANTVMTALITLGGIMIKYIHQEIRDLKKQNQNTREQFVHKEDLKEFKNDLNRRLDELKDLILYRVKKD